jgi:2,3-bisphosphoglycerate-dependent phosphoglycerate mutase
MASRVLLIRHCQSNGRPEPADRLTTLGLRQAASLATHLRGFGIDGPISSPHMRARQTIAPFAAASGLALDIDDRLAERRLTSRRFTTEAEWLDFVGRSFDDLDLRAPDGESAGDAQARGVAALMDALASPAELPALVSHGQLLSLVLTGIEPAFGFAGWLGMTNPDVFLVQRRPDGGLGFSRAWPEREAYP